MEFSRKRFVTNDKPNQEPATASSPASVTQSKAVFFFRPVSMSERFPGLRLRTHLRAGYKYLA
jgi:hypothetical protein